MEMGKWLVVNDSKTQGGFSLWLFFFCLGLGLMRCFSDITNFPLNMGGFFAWGYQGEREKKRVKILLRQSGPDLIMNDTAIVILFLRQKKGCQLVFVFAVSFLYG